jgi:hypothetical protein
MERTYPRRVVSIGWRSVFCNRARILAPNIYLPRLFQWKFGKKILLIPQKTWHMVPVFHGVACYERRTSGHILCRLRWSCESNNLTGSEWVRSRVCNQTYHDTCRAMLRLPLPVLFSKEMHIFLRHENISAPIRTTTMQL